MGRNFPMVNKCIINNKYTITDDLFFEESVEREPIRNDISLNILDDMTPMQKHVIELLKNPLTPGQIADRLDLEKYKSRQHAVRSVNNILKQLMKEDLVERRNINSNLKL